MRTIVVSLLALVLLLAISPAVQAEAVGRFTEVEGPVDLLKKGQLPLVTPKVQDPVEPGDVVRTKSQGRAQLKFVDDSVLTIAPGSRVAIESYMYDAAKGSRQAVLQVFRGMVHSLVSKILKTREPDFIMKTHTAVLGVRGTEWYALLGPNHTDIYNESGRVCVHNIYAEVPGEVCLNAMEFTRVMYGLTPTVATPFQKRETGILKQMMKTGGGPTGGLSTGTPGGPGGGAGPDVFSFLDRLGVVSPPNPATNPTTAIIKPPPVVTLPTVVPGPLISGGAGGGGTPGGS